MSRPALFQIELATNTKHHCNIATNDAVQQVFSHFSICPTVSACKVHIASLVSLSLQYYFLAFFCSSFYAFALIEFISNIVVV